MAASGLPPGLQGARQQQHEPMKEEYPSFGAAVVETPNGRALVINVPLPRKTMIFPFDSDSADRIGKQLVAPSVVLP